MDTDETLLVVETGTKNLLRLDPKTGAVKIIAVGLEVNSDAVSGGLPPTGIFNGVAVDPKGVIYVTGDASNVLYRFESRR